MPRGPVEFNGIAIMIGDVRIMGSTDVRRAPDVASGRAVAGALAVLLGAPIGVAYTWICCRAYGGRLAAPLDDLLAGAPGALAHLIPALPRPTPAGFALFAAWYVLQAVLMLVLPLA